MSHEAEPTGVNSTKYVIRLSVVGFVVSEHEINWCISPVLSDRYVSQIWIRCLSIPVHTAEGGYSGSYSSLVKKLRLQKSPEEVRNILVRNIADTLQ